MRIVDPVILVPGITASYLRDDYPLPPSFVWKVIGKDYERIALHPDDLAYEAAEPALVRPDQVYEIAYEELVEELRYNLTQSPDAPVGVYPFGYDWRQPLSATEDRLAEFVDEVIERTKIQRHYHAAGYADDPKVNIVAHSMGGLLTAGYLEKWGEGALVNKVVSLASPFQGSFEAVIKVATGTANLGTSPPSSREREAARVTPALYHLLPGFAKGVTSDPGIPKDLYKIGAWQPSVLQTLAAYVRKHGVDPTRPDEQARELFLAMLEESARHRKRIDGFRLASAGMARDDWLAVVGVDAVTRVHLHIAKRNGHADFDFSNSDRANGWGSPDPSVQRLTGDGTVPFEGAIPRFLDRANLVCVSPEDFGYWELQDKVTTRIAGFHGILPNMNMLHRLIVRFLRGLDDARGATWGRRAPDVDRWVPPIPGLREKT